MFFGPWPYQPKYQYEPSSSAGSPDDGPFNIESSKGGITLLFGIITANQSFSVWLGFVLLHQNRLQGAPCIQSYPHSSVSQIETMSAPRSLA